MLVVTPNKQFVFYLQALFFLFLRKQKTRHFSGRIGCSSSQPLKNLVHLQFFIYRTKLFILLNGMNIPNSKILHVNQIINGAFYIFKSLTGV